MLRSNLDETREGSESRRQAIRGLIDDMKNDLHAGRLGRLARDIGPFLRRPISPVQASTTVRQRLANRDSTFLQMAEQHIYGHSGSPYLTLLKMAGCDLGDLRKLVSVDGLEGTLSRLMEAGVYVTFDEIKGRREAVRGSQCFSFVETDFDNPGVKPHFILRSGGTRGPGTTVGLAFDYISDFAVNTSLSLQVHGLEAFDHMIWVLPTGWIFVLRYVKLGRPPIACFYPMKPPSLTLKTGSWFLAAASRMIGASFPIPRQFDLQRASEMVDWLRTQLRQGRSICVTSYASSAVRVSLVAQNQGRSLEGVCFIALGEPVTGVKKSVIEASGARMLVHFGTTETGFIGYSCANPHAPDDIHLFTDCFALVQRPRHVGGSTVTVDAFALTSLLSSAPKILLNAETGDHGLVRNRRCGCGFEDHGLNTHIERIRSFEKLSSEGMTFTKADLLELLETKLPLEFGGTAADYQILEEELEGGLQRVNLVISPDVGKIDESKVKERFLDELARSGLLGSTGAKLWDKANTVKIDRRWPIATSAGKVLPFHILEG
jgi:hypothetical protein